MGSPSRLAALVAVVSLVVGASGLPSGAGAASNHVPGAPRSLIVDDGSQLGITGTPRFSWEVVDHDPDEVQTSYELLVARTSTTNPGDPSVVWDSGKVTSGQQTYVPYGGARLVPDTTWYWTVRTWDRSGTEGPFAVTHRFDTGLADGDWRAQWIKRGGFSPSETTPEDYSYVRKDVTLSSSPIARAVAYASASHQYQLWINGKRVDYGPSFSYPDKQYYQATDVTDALRAGEANAFGLLYHWYGPGQGRPAAEPGVIAQISIEHDDGSRELVVTDGSWRVLAAPWLPAPLRNDEGDHVERIDACAVPVGWERAGFDDSGWQPATALGRHPVAPWAHLVAQRPRVVEHPVRAVLLKRLKSGAYVADFGKVYAAVPTVEFASGKAGRTVHLRVGYALDADGQVSTTHANQSTDLSYEYIQRDGPQTFRPFLYMGFRYLQIDDPGETLARRAVVAFARHTAVPDEHAGTFTSSNSTLNAIWELARHSALYGSQEQFVDTPTREKGQFIGDSYYTSFADMRAFGERALTLQALHEFLSSQARYWPDGRVNAAEPTGEGARDIPDGTTAFPEWVWRVYLDTGDRDLLTTAYPVLVNISDYIARYIDPATGLVTNPAGGGTDYKGGIVDYPVNMRFGYDISTSAKTTVNVLAVDAFKRTADVAKALGLPDAEIQKQEGRAGALVAAINQRLRREDGTYIDGIHPNGIVSKHASEHANAYALTYGVVPAAGPERAVVARYIARLGMQMGPGTVYDLLQALDIGDRDADLVRILTDTKQPGYAQILAKGGTFVWETWMPIDALGDSMSHARGAIVLVAMQENLLGVRVRDPGWSAIDVEPPTGGLTHVAGTIPTPRGNVRVSWDRSGGSVTVRVTVPANASAVVHVPGKPAQTVGSGTHVVRASS